MPADKVLWVVFIDCAEVFAKPVHNPAFSLADILGTTDCACEAVDKVA